MTPSAERQKIRTFVESAKREIHRLGVVPRAVRKFPFDSVGLSTLSKAFAIAKACLRLASDHPDEAYGLSRSLVECATNLRYLTAVPSEQDRRTHDFVKFAMADKAFWYHHALEAAKTPKEKAELRTYAKEMGIADNPRLARQHWSGQGSGFVWTATTQDHPIDGAATLYHRKKAHAVDYYQTSSFVHCSLPAIDNYYVEDGVPFQISTSANYRETHQSTLFVVLISLHHAIGYVLFGLNTNRPARLDSLFQTTLDKMNAVPARHQRGKHR